LNGLKPIQMTAHVLPNPEIHQAQCWCIGLSAFVLWLIILFKTITYYI